MKITYYSTAYQATHGGRIQAVEFYRHLDQFAAIQQKSLFPDRLKEPVFEEPRTQGLKRKLKRIPIIQAALFFRRNTFYLKELEEILDQEKPDVLILQIDSNFLQIKRLKKRFPRLIICAQINGSPFDEQFEQISFKSYFQRMQSKAYSFSDLNFFISSVLRERIMREKLDPQRDLVIQNGTDTEKFKPLRAKDALRKKWGYGTNAFLIGYIGTLDTHKNLFMLVEAVAELVQKHDSLRLVIIGDGEIFPALKKRVQEEGLEEVIRLMGWVKHEEINEHLNCFDVAVHHFANDYMSPLKLFEYLAAELPVVGPDIPSVREVFTHGQQLLLTPPDKEALKVHLIELLEHEQRRKELGTRGAAYVRGHFTWWHYTAHIVQAIQDKIENRDNE